MADSISAIGHTAQLNTAWNIKNSVAASTNIPHSGCNTTASIASSRCRLSAGSCTASLTTRRTSCWVAITSSTCGACQAVVVLRRFLDLLKSTLAR